ncbi:DUF1631 family protein [Deefgea rivuli]|uniref:DUF1631 family protein n=1 Tax=Deefgea rivuli TaxID=400948 RepID=UPI00146FC1D3|nr:DUF1631 family protein [Deefgea rivuli]
MAVRTMDRNDLLIATRSAFLAAFNQRIALVLEQAIAQLFVKADRAASMVEQRILLESRQFIMSHTAVLEQQLVRTLEQLVHRSFQTAYSNFRPSFFDGIGSAGLTLVESASFEEELHIDQITVRFRQEAEEPLRDLNIRIALLFEQDVIKERENPFRTYVISRALATALEETVRDTMLIPALLEQMTESMCPHIAPIYEELNILLAQNGIAAQLQLKVRKQPDLSRLSALPETDSLPVADESLSSGADRHFGPNPVSSYAMNTAAVSKAELPRRSEDQLLNYVQSMGAEALTPLDEASSASVSSPSAPAAKPSWLKDVQHVGQTLKHFFTGHGLSQMGAVDAPFADEAAPHALRAVSVPLAHSVQNLLQVATPSTEAMWSSDGKIRNLILEQRQQLNDIAADADESMTIDVVAMLFEFILRDGKVPAEVRAQLGRLQFLVLKIALQDPNLFARKNHPARMLVNRIGSISLGMQQNSESAERVNAEICRIVSVILADETENLDLFTQMLDELDSWVANELAHCEKMASTAAQVLDHAKQRTLHFARITAMISDALSPYTIEPYLSDFLIGTWARAIELAGRENPAKEQRYRLVVPDLIWSLAPKVDREECRLLLGLIPSMVVTLREGVLTLGWRAEQVAELSTHLVDAHRLAMRSGSGVLDVPPPPLSLIHEAFSGFMAAAYSEEASEAEAKAPLNPVFIDEAIGALEIKLNLIDQIIEAELGLDSPTQAMAYEASENPAFFEQLGNGVAVEINISGTQQQAQLSWTKENQNAIVLTIVDHAEPAVLSLRAFRRLFARDRVRFLEESQLFDRAMVDLLRSADDLAQQEV